MAKYEHLICTNTQRPAPTQPPSGQPRRAPDPSAHAAVLWIDQNVVPAAPYLECHWIYKPSEPGAKGHPEHYHEDMDEIIAFFGSDKEDPTELNGEVNLGIGSEIYSLTKSCVVFVPRGLKHCPLTYPRVDKPIFHFTFGNAGQYKQIITPES